MDYYSLFWGPGGISTIDAPRGAFTCRSPAILVLFDSGLFHGLLLTILGPQTGLIVVEPQGAFMCRSSTLTVLAVSGTLLVLLITVFGSRSDFND